MTDESGPCSMCHMPYHRYCPEDPEHEWSPVACINALTLRIERLEGELDRAASRAILEAHKLPEPR